MKAKGLGRGLDALLDREEDATSVGGNLATLKVERLQRGRYQPRTRIDEEAIRELADSIRKQGLMQPILVRSSGSDAEGPRYEIIAGERRWRAAQVAGLAEVPVVIREVSDQTALAMALIENIQREDLNPMEQAQGLQRLAAEFGMTHQEIAESVGRSRVAITNLLRLLNLAQPVQDLVLAGKLDMGHARALLALDAKLQESTARRVVDRDMSVRETENWVNELLNPVSGGKAKVRRTQDRDVARLAEELSERFGTAVEIRGGRNGSGRLVIRFTDNRHLESLLARFH